MSKEQHKNKVVRLLELTTQKETTFENVKLASAHTGLSPAMVRVCSNCNIQFMLGNRMLPKYCQAGVLYYSMNAYGTFNSKLFLERFYALEYECQVCLLRFARRRELATHIQFAHKIKSEEYTLQFLYDNKRPNCSKPACNNLTRYVSFKFKEYCKNHSAEAMKKGGKVGGHAEAWNKGKTKFDDKRIMKQALEMMGQKNHFFDKQHSVETIKTIADKKRLSKKEILERLKKRENDFIFEEFEYEKYVSRQHQKIQAKCVKCNNISKKTLQSLERGTLCKFCYPFTVSKGELDLGNYVESLTEYKIIRNDRKTIAPYELDIYIPEINLAFEYHGLYWHMDKGLSGFDKSLHYKKYLACKDNDIQLIQIFSNQWEDKNEIVKSMIKNKLGANEKRIGARETNIVDVQPSVARKFFGENHLHGWCKAKKYFGLEDKVSKELLSVVSVRTPFHKAYSGSIEIARFATKKNITVICGFSKLLSNIKKYAKNEKYKSIISYADLLHGNGNVYSKTGFKFVRHTGINYWYTDGISLFNRFKFRATNDETEKQVAAKNNVYRIYGCGNALYELKIL